MHRPSLKVRARSSRAYSELLVWQKQLLTGLPMLDSDRRQTEREAERDDQKVIVCLLAALLFAIVFAGAGITTSLLWPAQAYPIQWD